jgi:hypothetical protein
VFCSNPNKVSLVVHIAVSVFHFQFTLFFKGCCVYSVFHEKLLSVNSQKLKVKLADQFSLQYAQLNQILIKLQYEEFRKSVQGRRDYEANLLHTTMEESLAFLRFPVRSPSP